MEARRSVLVQFPDDKHPELWHERVLLALLSRRCWLCLTPGQETNEVDFSELTWRLMRADRSLPPGVKERNCYLVYIEENQSKFLLRSELDGWVEEAEVRAADAGQVEDGASGAAAAGAQRGGADAAMGGRSEAGVPGAASSARALSVRGALSDGGATPHAAELPLARDDGLVWVAIETVGDVHKGSFVAAPTSMLTHGNRGITLVKGQPVFCRRASLADAAAWRQEEAPGGSSSDARTLPIQFSGGARGRPWSTVEEACQQEEYADFPVTGPRTAGWCLRFLKKRHSPADHHALFRTMTKLPVDAWGMQEHDQLLRMLDAAGTYDQLDLCNLGWAELAFRRLQTIEWVHHDRVREAEGGAGDKVSPEEFAAFSGSSNVSESLMVAPALLSHVKEVVEADASIMKSVRKAREERELRRGPKGPKPKKEAGGQ